MVLPFSLRKYTNIHSHLSSVFIEFLFLIILISPRLNARRNLLTPEDIEREKSLQLASTIVWRVNNNDVHTAISGPPIAAQHLSIKSHGSTGKGCSNLARNSIALKTCERKYSHTNSDVLNSEEKDGNSSHDSIEFMSRSCAKSLV